MGGRAARGRYRAGAGEVARGGGAAGRRGELGWTESSGVDEVLVELVVGHLETDDRRHRFSVGLGDQQRRAGRHHRPTPVELAATCQQN